ncbi:MAG: hypothetical protein AAF938_21245 [Myxococcota bacterium]
MKSLLLLGTTFWTAAVYVADLDAPPAEATPERLSARELEASESAPAERSAESQAQGVDSSPALDAEEEVVVPDDAVALAAGAAADDSAVGTSAAQTDDDHGGGLSANTVSILWPPGYVSLESAQVGAPVVELARRAAGAFGCFIRIDTEVSEAEAGRRAELLATRRIALMRRLVMRSGVSERRVLTPPHVTTEGPLGVARVQLLGDCP